jgi:SAM-dependent methyltransferase
MKLNDSPVTASDPTGAVAEAAGSSPDPRGEPDAWRNWLASPPGRYVLEWEQAQFDAAVVDVFGYHALQCGLPEIDALRENRMPHRFHAGRPGDEADLESPGSGLRGSSIDLWLDHYEALPFASQSLDLVVLPHVLEFADDPHLVLREVDRVLRPEGRVIVSGFNPVSLWGARQLLGRPLGRPFLPAQGQFIGVPRLRDWFKLLGFDEQRGRFGCYRPPCRTDRWLERTAFMEPAGDRWWPICGAMYAISAVKRVRGMRLVGAVSRRTRLRRPAVAVASPGPTRGQQRLQHEASER